MFNDEYTRNKVYMVYFHASSCNSSGWLNDTRDIVSFAHFMSHGLQFDNPVDAKNAAEERLSQLKEFYNKNNISMTDFRYEYEIFTNVRSNEIEDFQDVSSGSNYERNEYEYLKKKYSEIERFIELNKRYGNGK